MSAFLNSIWAGVLAASALQQAATVLGLLGVTLAIRQSLWNFPVGLVQVSLTAIVFYNQRLYADMSLQAVYFVALAYGWRCWLRPGVGRARLPVTRLRLPKLLVVVLAGLAATACLGSVLANYGADPMPFRDAFIGSFGITAQLLQARKKLETWAGWLLVNLAGVVVYALLGLYWFVVLYLVYAGLAVAGFFAWRASLQDDAKRA